MRSAYTLGQAVESIRQQAARHQDPGATSESLAMAVVALEASGDSTAELRPVRDGLARWQGPTGAVLVDPTIPQTFWPTAWAMLAWHNDPASASRREKSVRFLTNVYGSKMANDPRGPLGHNGMLSGWPWVHGTHSWVQPTSLAAMALHAEGLDRDPRVGEAVDLLRDRQLPGGGWNYGNTRVYRNTLRPMPEDTGYALTALGGQVETHQVGRSLDYLAGEAARVRAPASLAWSILGLSAWGRRPATSKAWVEESLNLQSIAGLYPLRYLAQLVIAFHAEDGFASLFREEG